MESNEPTTRRKINVIEYTQSTRKANILTKKGKQAQTAALNINLKTINKNELLKMVILSHEEKNIIADYLLEKANFLTTRKLFGVEDSKYSKVSHKNIKLYMHKFYQNTRFVEKILNNENMDFPNKLILLKFILNNTLTGNKNIEKVVLHRLVVKIFRKMMNSWQERKLHN